MIVLTGDRLDLRDFVKVARGKEKVEIADSARDNVHASRQIVEETLRGKEAVYGVNTGFGRLSEVQIGHQDLSTLQENLLKSHACGTGEVFDEAVVRGMMLLRVNALLKGVSAIRHETLEKMVEFLNKGIVPVVYEQGSLGASGDLVPLAHMALPLIAQGEVFYQGKRFPASQGLERAGIRPLDRLQAKEGLALINGTQAMTSVGALALQDAYDTFLFANLAGGLSFEALRGIKDVFDSRVHAVRGHEGQIKTARLMREILDKSKNTTDQGALRVQDAYSLRCIPQVHGATLTALDHMKDIVEKEMNAVTDNPLVFDEERRIISAGNFHGQTMSLPLDYLAIVTSELGNISERRLERMVNHDLNKTFPPFLTPDKGLNSGFMIVQYAAASLVSENKVLSHPASVDSIPSSANQEDHVSMGTIAARKAMRIVTHVRKIVAMEMFTAAQALDFHGKEGLSPVLKKVYATIREHVPFLEKDEIMQPYMDAVERLLKEKRFDIDDLEALLWKKS